MDANMMKHMELTPSRRRRMTTASAPRASPAELKRAIAKYADTAAAVADGYKMFLPNVKKQKVYHFTNNRRAFRRPSASTPTKPTSLLYSRGAGRQARSRRRDVHDAEEREARPPERPRSTQHRALAQARELVRAEERRRSALARAQETAQPVFGPESPIATKAECDAVSGDFHPSLFGWMIHANVYEGSDLGEDFRRRSRRDAP